jgi:hypothetical protein
LEVLQIFEISRLGNQSTQRPADAAAHWRAEFKLIRCANYGTLGRFTGHSTSKGFGDRPCMRANLRPFLAAAQQLLGTRRPLRMPIDAGAQGSFRDSQRLGLQAPTFVTSGHPIAPSIVLILPKHFLFGRHSECSSRYCDPTQGTGGVRGLVAVWAFWVEASWRRRPAMTMHNCTIIQLFNCSPYIYNSTVE